MLYNKCERGNYMTNYFSKNLKYLREKKGIEQQELADELKVPRSTLSCWENDLRTPKIEQIQEIADYFNVNMDIISRDYSNNNYKEDDIKMLLDAYQGLSDTDKEFMRNMIIERRKLIDKQLEEKDN